MPIQSMLLSERQEQIVDIVRQADLIRVKDLSRHFQVTTQTIRRDLNLLCEHSRECGLRLEADS